MDLIPDELPPAELELAEAVLGRRPANAQFLHSVRARARGGTR
jgi:hypothetical protein